MARPLQLTFVESASRASTLPDSPREVAFVGRSNVGKSSLINAIANRKQLARVSNTPGRTQLINLFRFDEGGARLPDDPAGTVVDLPGYGFAKLSKRQLQEMANMINDYMTQRETVLQAISLFDANVGPTELDLQTIDWLRHIDLEIVLVGTKVDKIKPSQRGKKQRTAAEKLGVKSGQIAWVSSDKGTGIPELRSKIAGLLSD